MRRPRAAVFLRRIRRDLRNAVAHATGMHQYTVDHILSQMIQRSRRFGLHLTTPPRQAQAMTVAVLSLLTIQVAQTGYHRVPL
jgi:hypothetical protein